MDVAKGRLLQRKTAIERRGEASADGEGGPAELLQGLADHDRQELEEISAALERLKTGNYGRCEACGNAIGSQRLSAIPEARFCIACAQPAR